MSDIIYNFTAYSPFQMSFITWLPPAHSPREQLLHFTFNSDSMWSHFKTVYYLCKLLSRAWVSLSRGLGCYSEECLHSSVCWATFESHPSVAVHQIMVKPSQTSPPLARTASRSEPRSLHPSSSSFSSSSTYGSTFAFAYHCVCNSFLALLPQPLLSETCPFKATTSPLRLISGSPWGDGGEKKYYATTCIWLNSTSVAQSIIPLLRFSLGGVICIHKAQVRSKIFRLCFIFVVLKSALLFRLPYICVCCKPTRKSHFDFDWIQSKGSTILALCLQRPAKTDALLELNTFGRQQRQGDSQRAAPVAGIDEWESSGSVKGFSLVHWRWPCLPVGNVWGLGHVGHLCDMQQIPLRRYWC